MVSYGKYSFAGSGPTLLKGIIFIILVNSENLICERGGQDLSENIHKSIWCELKSPQKEGVFFRLYEINSFLVVKIELSMHICSQNDCLDDC